MKKLNRVLTLTLALLLLCSLCACGSSAYKEEIGAGAYINSPAYAEPSYATDMEDYGGFAAEDYAYSEDGSSSGTEALPAINPDKIIYTANATVETTDFETTLQGVEALVKGCGGFIESSSINGSNYSNLSRGYTSRRSASYTLRIPCEQFNTVMNDLTTLGNVPYTSTYTENISAQYYDTQARMEAYKAQETSLIAMLEKAETVADIITIEDKLSDVRYRIESLQSTLTNWDRQVSYSTIYLSVNEVTVYTPPTELTFGEKLANAFTDGIAAFGDFLQEVSFFVAESFLFLLLLAGIIVLVVFLSKKRRAARKAAKAAKQQAKAEAVPAETPKQ